MCGLKYRKELIFMTKRKMQIMSPDGDYTTQLMPETDAQYVLTSDGDNVENKITVNTQQINNFSDKIGVETDTSTRPTIFGRLKQIYENVLTRSTQTSVDGVKVVADDVKSNMVLKSVWTDARAGKLDNLNQSLSTTQTNIINAVNSKTSGVVKSVQKGTVAGLNAVNKTTNVTISSVNVQKSIAIVGAGAFTPVSTPFTASGILTSSTNLQIGSACSGAATVAIATWQVIEFY